MNNAIVFSERDESEKIPFYRGKAEELTEVIEALQQIVNSSYWKVLTQHVFEVDLLKAKSRLASEKDTTEIFRLQGEIRWGEKFDLEKLIKTKRNELDIIKQNL